MSKRVKETGDGHEVDEFPLTGQQVKVLGLLLEGKTQREAADVAGVNEATISRWINGDPGFIAAYNMGLQSLYDAGLNELLELRRRAIQILGEQLERNGSFKIKAAELILKHTPERPNGMTDPVDIATEQRRAELYDFGL